MPHTANDTLHLVALSTMLMLALYQDAKHRKIPNTLVLAGMLTGLGLAVMPTGMGLFASFMGGMVGLVLFGPLYFLRFLGAGDVKLVSATGFFVGFPEIAKVALCILLTGGVLSFAWGFWTAQLMPALLNLKSLWARQMQRFHARASSPHHGFIPTLERVPYAIAIAAGTWLQEATPWSPL
jgi:prepilin peptidase CpaA